MIEQVVTELQFDPDSVRRLDRVRKCGWTPEAALQAYRSDLVDQLVPLFELLRNRQLRWILDIGCGLAGMTAALVKLFDVHTVHLLDGDPNELGEQHGGFGPAGKPWNSVKDGLGTLHLNAPLLDTRVHYPGEWIDEQVDLIMSLKSWCHHYPVGEYLFQVGHWLRPGGLLVVDVREGTDGLGVLERSGFKTVGTLERVPGKRVRIAFEKTV